MTTNIENLATVLLDSRFVGLPDDTVAMMLNVPESHRLGFVFVSPDDVAAARLLNEATPPPPPPPPPPETTVLDTIHVIGSGAPAGTVLAEYAHFFAPGVIMPIENIASENDLVQCQMDVRTTHADGSVAHANIALRLPELADGEVLPVRLVKGAVPAYSPPPVSTSVVLKIGSWTMEPAGLLADDVWRVGPLVLERRYITTVPQSVCGSAGMRAILDVIATADGGTAVSVALRNDICFPAGVADAAYTAVLTIGGVEVMRENIPLHQRFSAFVRHFRHNAPPAPTVRPDLHMIAARAIAPMFDAAVAIPDSYVTDARTLMAAGDWARPFDTRGLQRYMPAAGGREEIGIVPAWIAAWLLSGSADLLALAHGRSEALAGAPWHFFDAENYRWLNVLDRPGIWTDPGGRDARGFPHAPWLEVGPVAWHIDDAHMPDAHSVLYALTGRRSCLDGLLAQASWSVMGRYPGDGSRGTGAVNFDTSEGINLFRNAQTRGTAWMLRQVINAALLAPAHETPHGDLYWRIAASNAKWFVDQMPTWTARHGEIAGFYPPHSNGQQIAPWQHNFQIQVMSLAAMRGIPHTFDAVSAMAKFATGIINTPDGSFGNAAAGWLTVIENGTPFKTWAELDARFRLDPNYLGNPPNWERADASYFRHVAAALALLTDVLPSDATVQKARQRWLSQNHPRNTLEYKVREPQTAIVPRDFVV